MPANADPLLDLADLFPVGALCDEYKTLISDYLGHPQEPSPSPPPQPSYTEYVRRPDRQCKDASNDRDTLTIRLVGAHPLWGHYLWNSAKCFADYLDLNAQELCMGKNVLELGAGAGLPSLVTALNGARKVVTTDYPDAELIQNLTINVEKNISQEKSNSIAVEGFVWGASVSSLLQASQGQRFDLILMSDLLFNHSQHDALLKSCQQLLTPAVTNQQGIGFTPCCLVFFTHHRPRFADRDLAFFAKAQAAGWECEKIFEKKMQVMFPEDLGDEEMRATVHGWKMRRSLAM